MRVLAAADASLLLAQDRRKTVPRMPQSTWKSSLQHGSPQEYHAALLAEYARLGALREAELESGAAGQGRAPRPTRHDEHGIGPHTESARPGGWKARHSNDIPDDPASGMTEEEKFTYHPAPHRTAAATACCPTDCRPASLNSGWWSRFDLSGFFVRPAILTPAEIAAVHVGLGRFVLPLIHFIPESLR